MIVEILEDSDGELVLPIPESIMNELGWKVGDTLIWEETEMCEEYGEHRALTLSLKKNYDKYQLGIDHDSATS